jgi:hypothetical protein
MSKINLTREDSLKTREIKGTSKLSTKKQKMCITYVSIYVFLIQFVSSMYKRLEPHLASSHENHKQEISGA